MKIFPDQITAAKKWKGIYRKEHELELTERISTRMVKMASQLQDTEFLGWQMYVPMKGFVQFNSFGTSSITAADLEWLSEKVAKTQDCQQFDKEFVSNKMNNWNLYEMKLPTDDSMVKNPIGFCSGFGEQNSVSNVSDSVKWPTSLSKIFSELVRVLRIEGAIFRYVVGKATDEEQSMCEKKVARNWSYSHSDLSTYVGNPVRTKIMLLLPSKPSMRLKIVLQESFHGIELCHLGNISASKTMNIWNNPMLESMIIPDIAARVLTMEPKLGLESVLGVRRCEEDIAPIPIEHKEHSLVKSIVIGKGMNTSGFTKSVAIPEVDLKRHWQIIGQTGTGKSTLIINSIIDAIKKGYGITFFDPHGTSIDIILDAIPEEYSHKIRVLRFGDENNTIPINVWNTENHIDAEKVISDLTEIFNEINDPHKQGFSGPRWERWFSTFAAASIALLGKKASFESILTLSQNKKNMKQLSEALIYKDKKLSDIIREEYAEDSSPEYASLMNWCSCKLQKFISTQHLRNIFGTGEDAIDFSKSIEHNVVTLIDLNSPSLGVNASRILGTILIEKLWTAVLARKDREETHIVAIDEAHLFQTNPLPRMLAEGRKFGISMILLHQHLRQLTPEILHSLEANSANYSAFRLSSFDAAHAVDRLGNHNLLSDLCKLKAFTAITTISVDGNQTQPFTLQVHKPRLQPQSENVSKDIYEKSIKELVFPYSNKKALTAEEIEETLEWAATNPILACRMDIEHVCKKDETDSNFETIPPYIIRLREIVEIGD